MLQQIWELTWCLLRSSLATDTSAMQVITKEGRSLTEIANDDTKIRDESHTVGMQCHLGYV